jgi:drug/metabolite transporter (DMT)-like permease
MRFVCEFGHLAQLDRALASEAKGRRFESCNAHRAGDVKAVGQTDGRRTWHSSWLLVLASLLFAVMAVCAKEAAARLPGAQVACMRLSLGAVTVVVLAAGGLKLRPHNLAALLLRGLLGGGAVLFYFVAIAHLPVGVATLLNNSSPLFVAVFSWVFLREPMSLRTLLALLLTSVGVAMVVLGSGSFGGNRPLEWRWVLAALCSAVLAGGAVTTVRAMRKREGSWEIFLAFCLIGSLVTAVPTAIDFVWPTSRDMFWVVLTGLLSIGSQVLTTYSLKDVPAVRAGLILQLTPISTFALGAVWLGEFPSLFGWLGAGVTIGGVCWGMLQRSSK